MKKITLFLTITVALFFTACAPSFYEPKPINPNQYQALYEANYDMKDMMSGITIKKGTKFIPLNFGGRTYEEADGYVVHKHVLPQNTIGLEYISYFGGQKYIVIYPDGNMISDDVHILALGSLTNKLGVLPTIFGMPMPMNLKLIEGKRPFKLVENP